MAYLPIVYLFQSLIENSLPSYPFRHSPSVKLVRLLSALSFAILFFLSIARNVRSPILVPLLSLSILLSLAWIWGFFTLRFSTVASLLLVFVLIAPQIQDFSTAIVGVRGMRNQLSPHELVAMTFDFYFEIKSSKKSPVISQSSAGYLTWDEGYLSNPFLARLTNAKFPDNSLHRSFFYSESDRTYMQQYTADKLLVLLPAPLLSFAGIDVDKAYVTSFSFGDLSQNLVSNNKFDFGSWRTGHFFGNSMSIMGWSYILFVSLLLI